MIDIDPEEVFETILSAASCNVLVGKEHVESSTEESLKESVIPQNQFILLPGSPVQLLFSVNEQKDISKTLYPLAPNLIIKTIDKEGGKNVLLDFLSLYSTLTEGMGRTFLLERPYTVEIDEIQSQIHIRCLLYEEKSLSYYAAHVQLNFLSQKDYNLAVGVLCSQCIIEGQPSAITGNFPDFDAIISEGPSPTFSEESRKTVQQCKVPGHHQDTLSTPPLSDTPPISTHSPLLRPWSPLESCKNSPKPTESRPKLPVNLIQQNLALSVSESNNAPITQNSQQCPEPGDSDSLQATRSSGNALPLSNNDNETFPREGKKNLQPSGSIPLKKNENKPEGELKNDIRVLCNDVPFLELVDQIDSIWKELSDKVT